MHSDKHISSEHGGILEKCDNIMDKRLHEPFFTSNNWCIGRWDSVHRHCAQGGRLFRVVYLVFNYGFPYSYSSIICVTSWQYRVLQKLSKDQAIQCECEPLHKTFYYTISTRGSRSRSKLLSYAEIPEGNRERRLSAMHALWLVHVHLSVIPYSTGGNFSCGVQRTHLTTLNREHDTGEELAFHL